MTKKQTLEKIAAANTQYKTLETRNSDGHDFKEVAVWNLKKALEEAYEAGQKAGPKKFNIGKLEKERN